MRAKDHVCMMPSCSLKFVTVLLAETLFIAKLFENFDQPLLPQMCIHYPVNQLIENHEIISYHEVKEFIHLVKSILYYVLMSHLHVNFQTEKIKKHTQALLIY